MWPKCPESDARACACPGTKKVASTSKRNTASGQNSGVRSVSWHHGNVMKNIVLRHSLKWGYSTMFCFTKFYKVWRPDGLALRSPASVVERLYQLPRSRLSVGPNSRKCRVSCRYASSSCICCMICVPDCEKSLTSLM